jgi:hypothetical protein
MQEKKITTIDEYIGAFLKKCPDYSRKNAANHQRSGARSSRSDQLSDADL